MHVQPPLPGLFDEDIQATWQMPTTLPDLTNYDSVAIDLETYDPGLKETGPGWPMKNGKVVGIAIAVADNQWYLPIAHEAEQNFPAPPVINWLKDLCSSSKIKLFHNSMYDRGWLRTLGIDVVGPIYDTMTAAPLVDENRFSYSLNNLGKDYLGSVKDDSGMIAAAKTWGIPDPWRAMHKLPARFVGPYAEQDARLTFDLWQKLKPLLMKDNMWELFELECEVLNAVLKARARGVRIDVEAAERAKISFYERQAQCEKFIKDKLGFGVDIWSNQSLQKAFDAENIVYPYTPKGAPSFQATWLDEQDHWLPQQIATARKYQKAASTFIDSALLSKLHNGRVFCELHPLRSDDGGTVSGRFSSSNPNLQQVPARDPEIGKAIRSLFLPEEGGHWGSFDYSQQEPRLAVHFAYRLGLEGSREARDYYHNNPAPDFHQMVADMAGIPRKRAKIINLGLMYNMGDVKLCEQLGLPTETEGNRKVAGAEGLALFAQYHERVPFVGELNKYAMKVAAQRGYIKTLLGRRCRFDLWEPNYYERSEQRSPQPHPKALEKYSGRKLKRSFTHKAMNRLIQGSAADQTKKAMVELDKMGAHIMIQVHDEICMTIFEPEQVKLYKQIMEDCCPLEVPSKVDDEIGLSWGTAK